MINLRLNKILLILPVFFLSTGLFGFAEEEIITVSGIVTAINVTGGNISVTFIGENAQSQTVTLAFDETLEVFDAPGIEYIQVGDNISIDYYIDEFSNKVAAYLYKFVE